MTPHADPAHDQPMTTHETTQITDWCQHLHTIGRSTNTIRQYRIVLTRAAREMPYGLAATTEELAAWIATHHAEATRSTYGAALAGFYRWARKTQRLDSDPTEDLERITAPQGTPRPCTDAQLTTILAAVQEPRLRRWTLLAAYAGARCCEIAQLERRDVDAEWVRITGKGNRRRSVPTHPDVWAVVEPEPAGPLADLSAKLVSQELARAYRRAGVEVTAHQLRHWAGTRWQRITGDIRVTQQLLGHASPSTTQIYTQVAEADMRRAVLGVPAVSASVPVPAGAGR